LGIDEDELSLKLRLINYRFLYHGDLLGFVKEVFWSKYFKRLSGALPHKGVDVNKTAFEPQ